MADGFSPFTPEEVAALRIVRSYARHQPGCPATALEAVDRHITRVELIVSGRYAVYEAEPVKAREIL